jgi:hypothetical protein
LSVEERRVVTSEPVDITGVGNAADGVPGDTIVERRAVETVVEERPRTRTVVTDDPLSNSYAASNLIQTIVFAVVVLVLLVVLLMLLHLYLGLF